MSEPKWPHPVVAVLLLAVLLSVQAAEARFEPVESFSGRAQFTILQAEIELGNYLSAAPRVEWMMQEHAEELMKMEDGRLMSLAAWLLALPPEQRAGLTRASRNLEAAAQRKFQQLRSGDEERPEEWYALAARYPLSQVAGGALAEGSARALELGDLSTAAAMHTLALRRGWTPADDQSAELSERLEPWLRPLPGAAVTRDSGEDWHGPVPFDARWYGNVDAVGIWRFMPYASGRLTYVSSARRLAAFRPNGTVQWRWEATRPWIQQPQVPRVLDMGRAPVWSIAPVVDHSGAAQVLVVRQLRSGSIEGCLRAFRAADGRLLWSTEHDPAMEPLLIVSEPVVAGRHAYVVAVDSAGTGEHLVLAAVEVMTGKLSWKNVIATGSSIHDRRDANREVEAVWQQTAPTVDEEHVYVSPLSGWVIAAGRFDGQIRWAAPYPVSRKLPRRDEWRQYREHRLAGRNPRPPVTAQQLLRWHNTPVVAGDSVIVAPPDAEGEFALDRASGRVLWQTSTPEAPLLLGVSGERTIFGGTGIMARDSRTGDAVWTYHPAGGAHVSGPAVVAEEAILVPVSSGVVVALAANDGAAQSPATSPDFRAIVSAMQAKAVLEEMEALSSFGVPSPRAATHGRNGQETVRLGSPARNQ